MTCAEDLFGDKFEFQAPSTSTSSSKARAELWLPLTDVAIRNDEATGPLADVERIVFAAQEADGMPRHAVG
jgi:hypothetical protein